MNYTQTRQALQSLWGTHPAAPKFTQEDKAITSACYFRVLYKYSLHDVLHAIDKACRKNPTFIPSAFEIESNVSKTLPWEQYITNKYIELDSKYKDKEFCSMKDYYKALSLKNTADSEEMRNLYNDTCMEILERIDINERLAVMRNEFYAKAEAYYDKRESNRANADLVQMGLCDTSEYISCLE